MVTKLEKTIIEKLDAYNAKLSKQLARERRIQKIKRILMWAAIIILCLIGVKYYIFLLKV